MNSVSETRTQKIKYALFLFFLYFFVFNVYLETKISVFKYADEVLALSAVPIYFLDFIFSRKEYAEIRWYNVFIILSQGFTLAATLIYRIQPMWTSAMPDLLLNAKFWLALYVGRCLFGTFNLEKYAKAVFSHLKLIIWILTILTVIEYVTGGKLFGLNGYRYGLPSMQLFFGHPTRYCAACVFLLMVLYAIWGYIEKPYPYLYLLLILMCTTLRAKAIAAVLLFLAIHMLTVRMKKKIELRHFLVMLPILVLIAWNQLYYYFVQVSDSSARYQLTVKSVQVANDYFPLGSGFATFGSYFSGQEYSPLYYTYNLAKVWGLTPSRHSFLNDTFWPMIIAQSGWIGTILFIIALLCLFFSIQKVFHVNSCFYSSLLSGFIYLLISSSAESAFVHPYAIPMAVLIGCLLEKSRGEELCIKEK